MAKASTQRAVWLSLGRHAEVVAFARSENLGVAAAADRLLRLGLTRVASWKAHRSRGNP